MLRSAKELRGYEQHLVALLGSLSNFSLSLGRYEPTDTPTDPGAGVTITDMEVRSRVKTGDVTPVYVTVCNQGAHQKMVEVTLTDTSENIIIGRRAVTLHPGAYREVIFNWKTKGVSLGEHILDTKVNAVY